MPDIRIPSAAPGALPSAGDVAGPSAVPNAAPRAPGGLDAAANAVPTTRTGEVRQPGAPAGLPAMLRVQPTEIFELTDRYPNTVSLPKILRGMIAQRAAAGGSRASARAKAEVANAIAGELAKLGIQVPPELLKEARKNPVKILDALTVTPSDMANIAEVAAAAEQAGLIKPGEGPKRHLPQAFDLANLDQVQVDRPAGTLKRLAPGLYKGTLSSNLPDAQAKKNIVFAEILDRLSENTSTPEAEQFSVKLDGKSYTRVDAFLGDLVAKGWTVDVACAHRIANFTELNYKPDGAPDAAAIDVPAAVMVRTGVRDAAGREAIVPSTHAELRIHLAAPGADGPAADVKFYQGVPSTGFFPMNLSRSPEWCGEKYVPISADKPKVSGQEAASLLENAALLADLIKDVAKEKNLPMAGYGLTGVCMDSVQVLWTLAGGPMTYYPLLMKDSLLFAEIDQRLARPDHIDDARYDALRQAIAAVPSDAAPQADAAKRALSALPWSPGDEAFKSSVDARVILTAADRG